MAARISLVFLMLLTACGGAGPVASAPAPPARRGPDLRGLVLPDSATIAVREQTADQQVLHALNRLAFGPRPADLQAVRQLGVDRWIAVQLEPARLPDTAGAAIAAAYPALQLSHAEVLEQYPPNPVLRRLVRAQGRGGREAGTITREDTLAYREAVRRNRDLANELISARVARAVVAERQLEEVMTDFWLNHFSVFAGKGGAMRQYLATYERDAIRPHVLGRFRSLLGAVATSPAMLHYLDNTQSVADSGQPTLDPARRALVARRLATAQRVAAQRAAARGDSAAMGSNLLQQVQARRRGLNENYARELMELHTLGVDGGYTQRDVTEAARILTGWSIGRPAQRTAFQFNPLVHDAGAKVVLGTRFPAGGGMDEGERLLDLLAAHPSTARHIALKLARRFVSDTPPAELVQRAAATFMRTDGDLREVMRTIVTSPEFFSAAAWRAKVKSPFEVVVSALRALDAAPDTTARTAAVVARLGQGIYQHQAPNGWPETGEAWINTGAILNRINFGMAIASGAVPGVRLTHWAPYASLATLPREQQVDGVVLALLGGHVSTDMREVLVSGAHPMLPEAQRGAASGLAQIVGLAIGSPEFQRR